MAYDSTADSIERQHLRKMRLIAPNSPQQAFYELLLIKWEGGYSLIKISGCNRGIMDIRKWPFDSLDAAERRFGALIKAKTNPSRSGRRYLPEG
jgi:hypothetical protein